MSQIVCPACKDATVVEVGENPEGVKYFVCSHCRESKRWCSRCDQGWLYKWVDPTTNGVLFNCDECEATWYSIEKVGSKDTSQFDRPFDGSMEGFKKVTTYEEK